MYNPDRLGLRSQSPPLTLTFPLVIALYPTTNNLPQNRLSFFGLSTTERLVFNYCSIQYLLFASLITIYSVSTLPRIFVPIDYKIQDTITIIIITETRLSAEYWVARESRLTSISQIIRQNLIKPNTY